MSEKEYDKKPGEEYTRTTVGQYTRETFPYYKALAESKFLVMALTITVLGMAGLALLDQASSIIPLYRMFDGSWELTAVGTVLSFLTTIAEGRIAWLFPYLRKDELPKGWTRTEALLVLIVCLIFTVYDIYTNCLMVESWLPASMGVGEGTIWGLFFGIVLGVIEWPLVYIMGLRDTALDQRDMALEKLEDIRNGGVVDEDE